MGLENLLSEEAIKKLRGKDFGIVPSSRYDEKEFFARTGELLGLEKFYGDLVKNSGDMAALRSITGIAINYMPGDKGENARILREPSVAAEQAEALLGAGKKKMAKFVENNFNQILSQFSFETTAGFVVQYALPKDVKKTKQALENEDLASLKRMYFEEIGKNRMLMAGAAYLSDSQIRGIMERKSRSKMGKFFMENIATQKSPGRYEYDSSRAQGYVSEIISSLKSKDRPEAYLTLGNLFYQQIANAKGKK